MQQSKKNMMKRNFIYDILIFYCSLFISSFSYFQAWDKNWKNFYQRHFRSNFLFCQSIMVKAQKLKTLYLFKGALQALECLCACAKELMLNRKFFTSAAQQYSFCLGANFSEGVIESPYTMHLIAEFCFMNLSGCLLVLKSARTWSICWMRAWRPERSLRSSSSSSALGSENSSSSFSWAWFIRNSSSANRLRKERVHDPNLV